MRECKPNVAVIYPYRDWQKDFVLLMSKSEIVNQKFNRHFENIFDKLMYYLKLSNKLYKENEPKVDATVN